MKVMLFCGGLGMRMRDGVSSGPKPRAMVGERPLLWHVMRYYAHFGHTDFVLCLGYGASYVKDFFLHYDETRSNDFVLEKGATEVKLFGTDISYWRITFVDTGLNSPIGERLRRVRRFVEDEPMFMANYADLLTDAPLPDIIPRFEASDAVASLLAVPPQSSHHEVDIGDDDGVITQVTRAPPGDLRLPRGGRGPGRRRAGQARTERARDRISVQGLLATCGHGEGKRQARRNVPPRDLPVDDLGFRPVRCRTDGRQVEPV
jgi:glucose-1-phosphate cytidylyltransferase